MLMGFQKTRMPVEMIIVKIVFIEADFGYIVYIL